MPLLLRLAITTLLALLLPSFLHYILPPTKEEVNAFVRVCLSVCLSVCLLAKLLKSACIDFDEMLRVDMDELINFSARSEL